MAGRSKRSPDAELRSRTRFDEPQGIRLYVFERYAIIHKVMLSRSNAFVSFSVKSRKFRFQETDIYYYRMSLVITKDEFLQMKKLLALMDPLTGLSQIWFNFENTNKMGESLKSNA